MSLLAASLFPVIPIPFIQPLLVNSQLLKKNPTIRTSFHSSCVTPRWFPFPISLYTSLPVNFHFSKCHRMSISCSLQLLANSHFSPMHTSLLANFICSYWPNHNSHQFSPLHLQLLASSRFSPFSYPTAGRFPIFAISPPMRHNWPIPNSQQFHFHNTSQTADGKFSPLYCMNHVHVSITASQFLPFTHHYWSGPCLAV